MNARHSRIAFSARNTRSLCRLVCCWPLLACLPLACSGQESNRGPLAHEAVGALGLALELAPGETFAVVGYQIAGPQGFTRSGTIDVALSSTISATIGGLPAGGGYSITLDATSTDAATSCTGGASFDVTATQTVPVNVRLRCQEAKRTGSVALNGVLNSCPSIDGISADPAQVVVGGSVSLLAVAHDSDAGPASLGYSWSATGGTFSNASVANPKFTCTAIGPITATLTVSDGDPDANCAATLDTVITCSADEAISHPYPGITLIKRKDQLLSPTRQVKMNLVLVDLQAPQVRFKLTPVGENLPPDLFGAAGWPTPYPAFEVVRQRTSDFLESVHGQVAINSHFFAPFPVPAGSNQGDYAYLIGLAASRGNVYSGFESPFQNYAIVSDAPAINIDRNNQASVVHRDPAFADGKHVLENVTLFNALSGSAQIITSGVKSVPQYKDASHPEAPLIGNATYSNSNSWYNLVNSRTAIGLTRDQRTLVLFTVDIRPTSGAERSQGMTVAEVADVLLGYGVWDALNLDGGGSTSMAMQDPADNVRKAINVSSDSTLGRVQGSNLAVYSDGISPVTSVLAAPAPNAFGWHNNPVTLSLAATDLRNGIAGELPGWVERLHYSMSGAQVESEQIVEGQTASVAVVMPGITTVNYFASDAAGNDEAARNLSVRLDPNPPLLDGMPASDCALSPESGALVQVARVTASDDLSGLVPGSFQVTATSSDPTDPNLPDVRITQDGPSSFTVAVRAAKRNPGPARVYTITASVQDLAGNARSASATCVVAEP